MQDQNQPLLPEQAQTNFPLHSSPDQDPEINIRNQDVPKASVQSNNWLSAAPSFAQPPHTIKEAFKTLIPNALPLIFVNFILFSIKNVSLHLIKQKHDERLTTAVGVANTMLSVIGMALYMSFNTGLTSCSAHAFGAKNYQLVGFYLHRAFVINILSMIPGLIVLYRADQIAILLGFDEQTAAYTQQITFYCIIGVVALMVFNTLTAYLNACDIFVPSAIALTISAVVFWVLSFVLFNYYDMDILGVAISFNAMQILAAIITLGYILVRNPVPGSFFWFKRQSFQEIWSLFKYEFFVGSMVFLEWIAAEIIYLFAGQLTLTEVSALTIVYTNYMAWYCLPFSMDDLVLTFVGNAMGEGDILKAKNFIKAGTMSGVFFSVLAIVFYIFFSREAAAFYSDNEDVIEQSIKIFKVNILYYPADFLQLILSGAIRAIGKEKLGAIMFIVVFYILGLPLAYLLCFKTDLRVLGLAWGPIVCSILLFIWLVGAFYTVDWNKQVKLIQKKLEKDDKALMEGKEALLSGQ